MVFRTPVLLGVVGLQPSSESRKMRYRKGSLLNDQATPETCTHLPIGMMIDLPTEGIEAYVEQYLAWLPRRSDE